MVVCIQTYVGIEINFTLKFESCNQTIIFNEFPLAIYKLTDLTKSANTCEP